MLTSRFKARANSCFSPLPRDQSLIFHFDQPLGPEAAFHAPNLLALGSRMSFQNAVTHSNGEVLTGRLWRKDHVFFNSLPFYSDIPRMGEMAGPLEAALGECGERNYNELLFVS
jgi:hypothetical protein